MVLIVLNIQVTFNKYVAIYPIFLHTNQKPENLEIVIRYSTLLIWV